MQITYVVVSVKQRDDERDKNLTLGWVSFVIFNVNSFFAIFSSNITMLVVATKLTYLLQENVTTSRFIHGQKQW